MKKLTDTFSSSPWKFTNEPWERSFTRWQSSILLAKIPWIIVVTFPYHIIMYGIPKLSRTEAIRLAVPCLGIGMLLWALWCGGKLTKAPDRKITQLFQVAVRLLLFGASHGVVFSDSEDIGQLERTLRWIIVAALGMGTFEEQLIWCGCILGARVLFKLFTNTENNIGMWALFFCHLLLMRTVYAFRRREWRRILATTTLTDILNSDYSAEQLSSRAPVPENWHDDYFTAEEWNKVAAVVEHEGEEMVQRGSNTKNVDSYDWIHTYKRLGEGAYGVVRVVKNRRTGEMRAMKISRPRKPSSSSSSKRKENMATEAVLLRMLQHPNVVGFIEEVMLPEEAHLIMELCDGGSLAQLISSFGALDLPAVRWFARNIVAGLHYLHRHSISHQDVKPGNCLLSRQGGTLVLKLADLGLGSWKASTKDSSKVVGTPEYIAPEIGVRNASRRRMDIWSLGVCVLEMTTSRTLLDLAGADASLLNQPAAVIKHLQRMKHDPRLPSEVPAGDAQDFIAACLRVQPALRPTALALDAHPFLNVLACPTDSPSITAVLGRPLLEIHDSDLDETMLLPRLRRHALFWLNPRAVWRWLAELEEPFLNPEREHRFQLWMAQDPKFEYAAALICPVYTGAVILQLKQSTRAVQESYLLSFAQIAVSSLGQLLLLSVLICLCILFWLPRSMRMQHWDKAILVTRYAKIFRLLAPWPAVGMTFTPVFFIALFCSGFMTPILGELMLWCVVVTVKILGQLALQLHHDWGRRKLPTCRGTGTEEDKAVCAAAAITYKNAVPPETLDRTASSVIVVLFCASLCAYASFFVRLERRHHFRRLTKLKLVKANGEERAHVAESLSSESHSAQSSTTRSQSPWRERGDAGSPFQFGSGGFPSPSRSRLSPSNLRRPGSKTSRSPQRDSSSGSPRREGSSGSSAAAPTVRPRRRATTSDARTRPSRTVEEAAAKDETATASAEGRIGPIAGTESKGVRRRDRQEPSRQQQGGYVELASSDNILGEGAAASGVRKEDASDR